MQSPYVLQVKETVAVLQAKARLIYWMEIIT